MATTMHRDNDCQTTFLLHMDHKRQGTMDNDSWLRLNSGAIQEHVQYTCTLKPQRTMTTYFGCISNGCPCKITIGIHMAKCPCHPHGQMAMPAIHMAKCPCHLHGPSAAIHMATYHQHPNGRHHYHQHHNHVHHYRLQQPQSLDPKTQARQIVLTPQAPARRTRMMKKPRSDRNLLIGATRLMKNLVQHLLLLLRVTVRPTTRM